MPGAAWAATGAFAHHGPPALPIPSHLQVMALEALLDQGLDIGLILWPARILGSHVLNLRFPDKLRGDHLPLGLGPLVKRRLEYLAGPDIIVTVAPRTPNPGPHLEGSRIGVEISAIGARVIAPGPPGRIAARFFRMVSADVSPELLRRAASLSTVFTNKHTASPSR